MEFAGRAWRRTPTYIKTTFFSACLIGVLIHIFVLTNILPNLDSISTFHGENIGIMSGRWFSQYTGAISSVFGMPWVTGLLGIIYIAFSACLVVFMLKIHDNFACMVVSGLMVSMPTVACAMAFIQPVDVIFSGNLLAFSAVFIADRYKYGFIVATIPLALSMGCYQVCFGLASGFMVMLLIMEILGNQTDWKKTLLKGCRFVCTLIAGMIFYFVMVRVTTVSVPLSPYRGLDNIGHIPLSMIPASIMDAYKSAFASFFLNEQHIHYLFMPILFAVSLFLCGFLLVIWCIRKKIYSSPPKLIFLIILLLIFPLGFNIIYVMSPFSRPDLLMIYSIVFVPILMLAITSLFGKPLSDEGAMKRKDRALSSMVNLSCWAITLTLIIAIFGYGIVANKAYFKMYFTFQQTYAQSIQLASHIQDADGYTIQKTVVLLGRMDDDPDNYPNAFPELDSIQMRGVTSSKTLLSEYSYDRFLHRFVDFPNPISRMKKSDVEDAAASKIIKKMPKYPKAGSIVSIGDTIYVNFS